MPGLYSERFLKHALALATSTYTVPPGKRAVIRTVTIVNAQATASAVYVYTGGANLFHAVLPAHTTTAYTDARVVIYGGETIAVVSDSVVTHTTVSGYLFEDPARGQAADVVVRQLPATKPVPELAA